jgi:ABC-type proline/glycine betaine transport system permease subunit
MKDFRVDKWVSRGIALVLVCGIIALAITAGLGVNLALKAYDASHTTLTPTPDLVQTIQAQQWQIDSLLTKVAGTAVPR